MVFGVREVGDDDEDDDDDAQQYKQYEGSELWWSSG